MLKRAYSRPHGALYDYRKKTLFTRDVIKGIAEQTAEEQATTAVEMNNNIARVSQTAEQITHSISEIASAGSKLARVVDELNSQVKRFKV